MNWVIIKTGDKMKLKKKKEHAFEGLSEANYEERTKINNLVIFRLKVIIAIATVLIAILMVRLGYVQLVENEHYLTVLDTYGRRVYTNDAPRGNIVDANYNTLVSNTYIINVTYYDGDQVPAQIETIINFLTANVSFDDSEITLREKKDYYIYYFADELDNLISPEEKEELRLRDSENFDDNYYKTLLERITEDYLDENMTSDELERARLKYLIDYTGSSSVIISDISVEEASVIASSLDMLEGIQVTKDWTRAYEYGSEFRQVLGKVTTKKQGLPYEIRDELIALGYSGDSRVGVSGLEEQYEDILRGTDSQYTLSYDLNGNSAIDYLSNGSSGANIRLSVDWQLQQYADNLITQELVENRTSNEYFSKMFLTLMDPNDGSILAMSGKTINQETGDVYDYASGNYLDTNLIGSTIKGSSLYIGFKYGLILPNTYLMDTPIKIKGTPEKSSWKNMGLINEVDAMAMSSNVYMFRVAMMLGGANYVYGDALYINPVAFQMARLSQGELGLGVKTRIDIPNEQLGYVGSSTSPGFLLDEFIGQYDSYTMIQVAQYVSTLANGGYRVQPHFLQDAYVYDDTGERIFIYEHQTEILDDVSNQTTAFEQIKQGMEACVARTDGTAHWYFAGTPYKVYAKTGTAEVYDYSTGEDHPNHLLVGYIVDENDEPLVAFACIAYRQDVNVSGNSSSHSAGDVVRGVLDKYVELYGI